MTPRDTLPNLPLTTPLVIQAAPAVPSASGVPSATGHDIAVRTENSPRLPCSGATDFLDERTGQLICTKLEACNKFSDCEVTCRTAAPYATPKPCSSPPPGGASTVA